MSLANNRLLIGVIAVGAVAALSVVFTAGGSESETETREGIVESSGTPNGVDSTALPTMQVFKSPTCGCCSGWVEHVEGEGFQTEVQNTDAIVDVKRREGVPADLQSCHTALVDGYVIEGHVPADVIKRLLRDRPEIAGLAAPGMPVGSPGMEGPNAQPYDIIAFTRDGQRSVYATR